MPKKHGDSGDSGARSVVFVFVAVFFEGVFLVVLEGESFVEPFCWGSLAWHVT